MNRIILSLFLACMAAGGYAQSIARTETLKTTDLGNQKLMATVENNDTTYVIYIKTGSRVQKYFPVVLGGYEQAMHFLGVLQDVELKGDDVLRLENPSNNYVTKNTLGGLRVFDELKVWSGQLRKPNIKGFIKAIEEYRNKQ